MAERWLPFQPGPNRFGDQWAGGEDSPDPGLLDGQAYP
jgi:hypothetical protein